MGVADVSDRSLAELVSLAGRVAVVTGAARGIGLATAHRLAEAGAQLVVADLDEAAAKAAARSLADQHGTRVAGAAVDVADAASVAALADLAVDELGGIDIWVNNAGVYPAGDLLDLSDEEWDHVLAVNLRGTFLGAREAGRRMVAAGRGGVIVNVSSTSGLRSSRGGRGHYVASKHGVVGLTKALAAELGVAAIRVLSVAPTMVETPGVLEQLDQHSDAMTALREQRASMPAGRVGLPDDIARVILFCASDLAMLMTGSTVLVDGGADAIV